MPCAYNPILEAFTSSDLFGKIIFLILFVCSISTWALLIFEKIQKTQIIFFGKRLFCAVKKRYSNPLSIDVDKENHPFASVYRKAKTCCIEILKKNEAHSNIYGKATYLSSSDLSIVEMCLNSAVYQEIQDMSSKLSLFSLCAAMAPFFGLLGTVWGILIAFSALGSGAGLDSSKMVGSLAMALGTTVVGLLVAIPALIAHNYIRSKINRIESEMESFSSFIMVSFAIRYKLELIEVSSEAKV